MSYGLPAGTAINYGTPGFPDWVYTLADRWGLRASTYPGHQENERPDIGAAPNPGRENRGIDWSGPPPKMLDFARWLRDTGPDRAFGRHGPPGLEMVIYQDPRTGERVGYPAGVDYGGDYGGHTDHVHTRQSAPLTGTEPAAPPVLPRTDRYALIIIAEGRKLGVTARGIKIALAVGLVETTDLKNYANSNDPASMRLPHDAVGSDHLSVGVFQQQPPWGPLQCRMDVACSARLFYDCDNGPGVRGLLHTGYDYRDESCTPGFYAQKVQGSAFPTRYDERYRDAETLYDRLADTTTPPDQQEEDGFLMSLNNEEQRDLLDKVRQVWGANFNEEVSKSRYADPRQVWAHKDFVRNDDGFLYDLITEHDAALGDMDALARVERAAIGGDAIARRWLERLAAPPGSPADQPARPIPIPVPVEETLGELVGAAIDRLVKLHLSDALTPAERAPLEAIIGVLETKIDRGVTP